MSSAREEILTRMRSALEGAGGRSLPAQYELRPAPGDPTGLESAEGRVAAFVAQLERVGAHVVRVERAEAVPARLAGIVDSLGAESVAVSDAQALDSSREALREKGVRLCSGEDREALLEAGAGVSSAQWAIAETGSLVLVSTAEQHRLVSLVPPVHIALIEERAILGTLGDALRAVQGESRTSTPAAITLITGPSRTADIELTLVVGVHGPKELHVILIPSP